MKKYVIYFLIGISSISVFFNIYIYHGQLKMVDRIKDFKSEVAQALSAKDIAVATRKFFDTLEKDNLLQVSGSKAGGVGERIDDGGRECECEEECQAINFANPTGPGKPALLKCTGKNSICKGRC